MAIKQRVVACKCLYEIYTLAFANSWPQYFGLDFCTVSQDNEKGRQNRRTTRKVCIDNNLLLPPHLKSSQKEFRVTTVVLLNDIIPCPTFHKVRLLHQIFFVANV